MLPVLVKCRLQILRGETRPQAELQQITKVSISEYDHDLNTLWKHLV